MVLGEPAIYDFVGGDNSGTFDPGETDTLAIDASNFGHSACYQSEVSLNSESPYVTIYPSSISLDSLFANQTKTAGFEIAIDDETPVGTLVEFNCTLTSGAYQEISTFYFAVGLVIEDFETGDFSKYDWTLGGNQNWFVNVENPYAGNFSAQSGSIGDDETSDLEIEINVMSEGNIYFWDKVSSENNFDFLRFYVDDVKLGEWSGETGWEGQSFAVGAGTHTLRWSYEKDINNAEGADAAWLDNIVFPAASIVLGVNQIVENNGVQMYPNPATNQLNILVEKGKVLSVSLFDMVGSRIYFSQPENIKNNSIQLDVSSINAGIYLVEVVLEGQKIIKKVIVQ